MHDVQGVAHRIEKVDRQIQGALATLSSGSSSGLRSALEEFQQSSRAVMEAVHWKGPGLKAKIAEAEHAAEILRAALLEAQAQEDWQQLVIDVHDILSELKREIPSPA